MYKRQVTEFYLLGEDGLRIVGEVENIGPGLARDLVVRAAPGKYFTACKPCPLYPSILPPQCAHRPFCERYNQVHCLR